MTSYDDTFYSISVPSSGLDFSTSNIGPYVWSAESVIDITTSVIASAGKLFTAESNILNNSSVTSDIVIVNFADSIIASNSSIAVSSTITLVADSAINSSSSIIVDNKIINLINANILVNTSITANAYIYRYVISSTILSNSATTSNANIINSISSGISILPTTTITSLARILLVTSSIAISPNITVAISTVGFFIALSSNISSTSKVLVSSIDVLRTGLIEDSGDIKPFFILDGIPLTEHNRKTSIGSQPNYVINRNWTNKSGVYFKTNSNKKNFSIEWSFAPGKRENTVDLNASRDYVKQIALDPSSHVLKIREMNTNGLTPHTETSYNVLVTDFNENLVRRDLNNNEYYWNFSLGLQEV